MKRYREDNDEASEVSGASSKKHYLDKKKLNFIDKDHKTFDIYDDPVDVDEISVNEAVGDFLNYSALRRKNIENNKIEYNEHFKTQETEFCAACSNGFFIDDDERFEPLRRTLKYATFHLPLDFLVSDLHEVYEENVRKEELRKDKGVDFGEWPPIMIKEHLLKHMVNPAIAMRETLEEINEIKDTIKSNILQLDDKTGGMKVNPANVAGYIKLIDQKQRLFGFKPEKQNGFNPKHTVHSTTYKDELVRNNSKKKKA